MRKIVYIILWGEIA